MKMNDIMSQVKTIKNELGDVLPPEFVDRVLEGMGLQVRRSAVRGFASGTAIFLAGVVCGGAAALLLAPKAGLETRGDIEDKIDTLIEKVKSMIPGSESTESTGTSASSTSGAGASTRSDKSKESNTPANRPTGGAGVHHS
jgi:gas vesicle protein